MRRSVVVAALVAGLSGVFAPAVAYAEPSASPTDPVETSAPAPSVDCAHLSEADLAAIDRWKAGEAELPERLKPCVTQPPPSPTPSPTSSTPKPHPTVTPTRPAPVPAPHPVPTGGTGDGGRDYHDYEADSNADDERVRADYYRRAREAYRAQRPDEFGSSTPPQTNDGLIPQDSVTLGPTPTRNVADGAHEQPATHRSSGLHMPLGAAGAALAACAGIYALLVRRRSRGEAPSDAEAAGV